LQQCTFFFLANISKASQAKQKFVYCSSLLSRQRKLHRRDVVFIKTCDISLKLAGYIGAISLGRKSAISGPNIGVTLLRIWHGIAGVACTILAANIGEILFGGFKHIGRIFSACDIASRYWTYIAKTASDDVCYMGNGSVLGRLYKNRPPRKCVIIRNS